MSASSGTRYGNDSGGPGCSELIGNVVDIYRQGDKNTMVGQITGFNGPSGLATDTAGDLYDSATH